MGNEDPSWLPRKDSPIQVNGQLVTVISATATDYGAEVVFWGTDGRPDVVNLTGAELAESALSSNDGGGGPDRGLAGLWARWMQYAIPRIRSAVLATRPLQPYAHQDEAVFTHMLAQPRLRFLLADEPGTGKTIMTGMYLAEGRRRGLIPGNTVIVVPRHLVEKWQRDLYRHFAIEARQLTSEQARDPAGLDPRHTVWVVSLDLFSRNDDVRRRVAGAEASWSLAVFDEAHRLTLTSQYLGAAQDLGSRTHHLLLLTATPHRGKEHFFRALLNLLDPDLYPWDSDQKQEYERSLRPSHLSFLRRMKEDLRDVDGHKLFPERFSETIEVTLNSVELRVYRDVLDYVEDFHADNPTLPRFVHGRLAASSLVAVRDTLQRRAEMLRKSAQARSGELGLASLDMTGALDDEDAFADVENTVVTAPAKNKKAELDRVDGILATLRLGLAQDLPPAKWQRLEALLAHHGIAPDAGQLLVFTEFTPTARWLAELFRQAGYSAKVLEGTLDHAERDALQQGFLAHRFQVLVSTDAGGEGIDLQSAHVMVDWDIPWSLVRLEQRMGRLHRIGQQNPVFIYHLVSPQTREGRVQQVLLHNLATVSESLSGRIFDLLDATAERLGFDYTRAIMAAQSSETAADSIHVPDASTLRESAAELESDERWLSTEPNTSEADERLRRDRLEAINPVIVDAFVDRLAAAAGWQVTPHCDVEDAVRGNTAAIERLSAALQEQHPNNPPVVLDMFSGRGLIPLEAARLGITAVGVDLSPVATLGGRLLADYPLRDWSVEPPLPFAAAGDGDDNTQTALTLEDGEPRLLRDVRTVLDEVGRRVQSAMEPYYPRNPDGRFPWAYLWAITIPCDQCRRRFPLVGSLVLRHPYNRTRDGGQALRLVVDGDNWVPEVVDGVPDQHPTLSSASGKVGKSALCLFCGHVHSLDAVKAIGFAGNFRDALLAVADEEGARKVFRVPSEQEVDAAANVDVTNLSRVGALSAVPDESVPPGNEDTVRASGYGHRTYGELMNPRQTLLFVATVESITRVHDELVDSGVSAVYARALAAYAAANLQRRLRRSTRGAKLLCHGASSGAAQNRVQIDHIFADESKVSFQFDYLESGLGEGPATWSSVGETGSNALRKILEENRQGRPGRFRCASAVALPYRDGSVHAVVTDPPYYNMIDYADASDLFHVWFKRALSEIMPDLFGADGLQDKSDEIIVKRGHAPGEHRTVDFYERMLARSFHEARRVLRSDGHLVVVFGHSDPDTWRRLLGALHEAEFVVTSAWPSRTETANTGVASIKVTITIGCRVAASDRPTATAAHVDREVVEVVEVGSASGTGKGSHWRISSWLPTGLPWRCMGSTPRCCVPMVQPCHSTIT